MHLLLKQRNKIALLTLISVSFLAAPAAHAILYSPGETLDPACGPTDGNCGVASITILGNGNVGIGTSSPGQALSVQGDGLFSGTVRIANLVATGTVQIGTLSGLAGVNSGTLYSVSTSTLNIGGNAGTASTFETSRTINGVAFNGSQDITVTAASSTLLLDNNTFSGNNTFTVLPTLGTLSGLVAGNSGTLYQIATSSVALGFGLSGTIATLGTNQSLSIATSSLYSGIQGQVPYFSDVNTISAAPSLFLAANGNIGIGTTSPYSLLSISNNLNTSANLPLFTIASTTGGTATSTFMTVLANGNVGIGTANPASQLDLSKTFTAAVPSNYAILSGINSVYTNNSSNPNGYSYNIWANRSYVKNPSGYSLGGGGLTGYTVYTNNQGAAGGVYGIQVTADTSSTTDSVKGIELHVSNNMASPGVVPLQMGTDSWSWNNTSGSITANYGVRGRASQYDVGSITTNVGVYGLGESIWTGGTTGTSYGVLGEAKVTAGTITTSYGVYGKITRTGGSLGTVYGGAFEANAVTTGTNYGLYVGTVAGGVTDNYALYSAGTAKSYMAGNLGLGTTSPYSIISISNSASTAANIPLFTIASTTRGVATSTVMTVLATGATGVGTTSPWRTFSINGTVGVQGLTATTGAGSLCLSTNNEIVYNAGSDNCLSSLRSTKHDIADLMLSGTSTITLLTPVSFVYNNDASSTVRYGFIAEDTAGVDPHFATYDQSGRISGVDDRSILAIIVKALKELVGQVGTLASAISSYAESFTSKDITATNQLCVGSTCVTEEKLKQLLDHNGVSPIIITDVPVSSSTPPVIDESTTTPPLTEPEPAIVTPPATETSTSTEPSGTSDTQALTDQTASSTPL